MTRLWYGGDMTPRRRYQPQVRYFVVEIDDAGRRIFTAGEATALNAAQIVARAVPEIDAHELASTFNAMTVRGGTRYAIGAAMRGEPGYAATDVGKRWYGDD